MKFWNKWLRKIHRWFAVPTLILIPISVALKVSGNGHIMAQIPQWEIAQSLLMLLLAITGSYLYLIPYLSKRNRSKRRQTGIPTVPNKE
jgi:hypothetical protein